MAENRKRYSTKFKVEAAQAYGVAEVETLHAMIGQLAVERILLRTSDTEPR